MNKELIEKLKKDSQRVYGYTDGGYTPLYALDPEKFAELIIKECADLCLKPFLGSIPSSGIHFNGKIKEHFGIE